GGRKQEYRGLDFVDEECGRNSDVGGKVLVGQLAAIVFLAGNILTAGLGLVAHERDEVAEPGDADRDLEALRFHLQRAQLDHAAAAVGKDAQARGIDVILAGEISGGGQDIREIGDAVVVLEDGFTLAGAATVFRVDDDVAALHSFLDPREPFLRQLDV